MMNIFAISLIVAGIVGLNLQMEHDVEQPALEVEEF